jgi:hypothetical protein
MLSYKVFTLTVGHLDDNSVLSETLLVIQNFLQSQVTLLNRILVNVEGLLHHGFRVSHCDLQMLHIGKVSINLKDCLACFLGE